MKNDKPTWDEYFMELVHIIKKRSNCLRPHYGSLIVRDHRIVTTGYNGTPHGIKNCDEGGCDRCSRREKGEIQTHEYQESCICVHSEQNAIIQAAYLGVSTNGATMYSTISPCSSCAKLIINAGIIEYVYDVAHHDIEGINLLKTAGIEVRKAK
ncbi:MAG: cytidine/deoxycytidylate deaminase family protein [bacterium]|nr:cytidine/deoxycytidylate deaminase family protein [bacterium]